MIPCPRTPIKVCRQRDLDRPILTGNGRIRAYCHLHGSDHQRSLSINPVTGWGHCFGCQARIKVIDLHSGRPQEHQQAVPQTEPPALPIRQQKEVRLLQQLVPLMREALALSWKPQAYVQERCIPLNLAWATGLCFLSWEVMDRLSQSQRELLHPWAGRLLFPLRSPAGTGFIGRSLWRWQPGMDECAHKQLLNEPGAPRRWLKTNPAGWFGFDTPHLLSEQVTLVEGGFDRLALLAAGCAPTSVIALTGTAASPLWFSQHAPHVCRIVLALDADAGGTEATARLNKHFTQANLAPRLVFPPHDGWGKDWSERYRRAGIAGVRSLLCV